MDEEYWTTEHADLIEENMDEVQRILDVLDKRDRTAAGMTAPAYGLCMDEVFYPGVERSKEIRLR